MRLKKGRLCPRINEAKNKLKKRRIEA